MSELRLSFACGPYDRMAALKSGAIRPEGIALDYIEEPAPRAIFDRMVGRMEFDASELSASEFIAMTGRGDCPFVAIPVFPSKVFRHNFICINTKAGIRTPKDLEGKRIGVPLYTQTAAIFCRGLLQNDYGVDLSTVRWVQGAMEKPGAHGDPSAPAMLRPVEMEQNRSGKSLSDLLAEGAIDATLGSRLPDTLGTHPNVARLFANYREVEKDYYRRTHIFPIMHLVAIKKTVYEKNPWVARALYNAFEAAKDAALAEMKFTAALRYMLPWLFADIDEINEVFGGDPWPYGVAANRPTIEALVSYMVQQHMIAEPIPPERLFVPVDGG